MLDKIEVGKVYRWEDSYFFILKVDVWGDMITYSTIASDISIRTAPYNASRRILEYVS